MNPAPPFDARRVRALLAAERITHEQYAAACRLPKTNVSSFLTEKLQPSERKRQLLHDGLLALGLDPEVLYA